MPLFARSTTPLSQAEIFKHLNELRSYAVAPYSHYHVASIVEIKLQEMYFYTSGVNVEIDSHNRLSIHSEQNAIASAITLLGGDTKFSKIWIMAAPANASPDEKQSAAKSCGHCRQIMMSLAKPDAEIYVVALDGQFSIPDTFEKQFLPDSFSERDLRFSSAGDSSILFYSSIGHSKKAQAWNIIDDTRHLTVDEVAKYFNVLSPHIITPDFQTSPISACIIRCSNGRYAAGVLMQDIAFLTTDAIFAALGSAITQFGNKNLHFEEIHLASTTLHPGQLSSAEIEALSHQYVHQDTAVYFHVLNKHAAYKFSECVSAQREGIDKKLNANRLMTDASRLLRAKL